MKNTQKYVIIFAKDEEGAEIKYRFMLCLSKSLADGQGRIAKAIQAADGVDMIQPVGRYTADITISRAFDADEVLASLKELLDSLVSDIIVPSKVIVA